MSKESKLSPQFPTVIEELIKEYDEGTFRVTKVELSLHYSILAPSGTTTNMYIPLHPTPGVWSVRWAPPLYAPKASYRILLLYHSTADMSKLPSTLDVKKALPNIEEGELSDYGNILLCSDNKPLLSIGQWNATKIIFNDLLYATSHIIAIPFYRRSTEEANAEELLLRALLLKATNIMGGKIAVEESRYEMRKVDGIEFILSMNEYPTFFPEQKLVHETMSVIITETLIMMRPTYTRAGVESKFTEVPFSTLAPHLQPLSIIAKKVTLLANDFPRLLRENANMRMIYECIMEEEDKVKGSQEEDVEERIARMAVGLIDLSS